MRAGVLVAVLVLTTGLSGCIDVGERWADLRSDLEAEPAFEQRMLLEEEQPFAASSVIDPTAPPQGPSGLGDRWNTTFTVPEGTRSLTIVFTVNFTADDALPAPPPGGREGQARVFVSPPGEAQTQDEFYEASGSGGFDFRGPPAGDWQVGFDQALGEGQITFRVSSSVKAAGSR